MPRLADLDSKMQRVEWVVAELPGTVGPENFNVYSPLEYPPGMKG
jgi:hypothetical protein